MSIPFSVNPGGPIDIIQLLRHGSKSWKTDVACERKTFRIGRTYRLIRDRLKPVERTGRVIYKRYDRSIDVSYNISTTPVVAACCCDNLWTGLAGVLPKMRECKADVVIHIGDMVYMDPYFYRWMKGRLDREGLLIKMCELYLKTWERWEMNRYQHLSVPDNHEWLGGVEGKRGLTGLTGYARSRMIEYYVIVTHFLDTLCYLFNGKLRGEGDYYTARLDTSTTSYLAIANWRPDDEDIPHNKTVKEILTGLNETKFKDNVILLLGQGIYHLEAKGLIHGLVHSVTHLDNKETCMELLSFKQRMGIKGFKVICGDHHTAISLRLTYGDGTVIDTHSVGTLTNVIDKYYLDDFSVPASVSIKEIEGMHNLAFANSFLLLKGMEVERVIRKQKKKNWIAGAYKFIERGGSSYWPPWNG